MKNYWKQFAEWATGLKYNAFRIARLKLTIFYIGIVAVILIIFSLVLYYSLAKNIHDNFEAESSNNQTQALLITKTTDQLKTTIFFVDLIVLFVSSGLSYFLAGRTLKPIQEMMSKQKQFTADASHELRTPLAIIQTNLEVALREKDRNQQRARAFIVSAIDEVKLMTKLIEDLLALSRLESQQKTYVFKKIDVAQVLERTIKKMQNVAAQKQVRISMTHLPKTFIEGNAEDLERLMMNILSNALNFTPAEGSVEITIEHYDKKIEVRIKDTGIGIAKEDLPNLFKRFYRTDKARERGGTGLGLAIAEEIVHKHQGSINIESELGKGTSVIITLPAIL